MLGAAAAVAILPASASAAETPANSFGCSASAARITALGLTVEPAVAKRGEKQCVNEDRTLLRLPENLPLLGAAVVPAVTHSINPGTPKQAASAVGGLAGLRLKALPEQSAVQEALTRLVAGIQPIDVNLGIPGLPSLLKLDIRKAVTELLANRLNPDVLSVEAATAKATATCVNGKAVLAGSSNVAGVKLLGQPVPLTNDGLEQVVNLIDTANLDLSKINIDTLGLPLDLQNNPLVRNIVRNVLANVKLQLPPGLAHVKLTAREQLLADGRLTQRALTAKVSLLGVTLLDGVIGEATVTGKDCPTDKGGALLACTKRKLVLTDVVRRGSRVRLEGVADQKFIGKTVSIYFFADGKKVATAKVNKDRTFTTTAPLPKASVRNTNKARYQARIGDERSFNLKLMRRMIVTDSDSQGGNVSFAGRVTQPLTRPAAAIVVKRRLSCKRWERAGTIKPSSSGRFKLTVKAPEQSAGAVVYRLSSRVHKNRTNKKTYPTYTLPLGVNIKY